MFLTFNILIALLSRGQRKRTCDEINYLLKLYMYEVLIRNFFPMRTTYFTP